MIRRNLLQGVRRVAAPCPACEKRKAAIAAFAKTVQRKLKGKK